MRNLAWVGVILIVLGVIGLIVQNVHFREEKTVAKVGPLQLRSEEQHNIPIPTIAGIAAIIAGLGLVLAARRST